jgi:hypothetical protein
MGSFLEEIKKIVETHPSYTKGDFEIKHHKGFETVSFCDIAVIRVMHMKNEDRLEVAEKYFRLFGLGEFDSKASWIRITYDDQVANTIKKNSKEVFIKCYKDSAEYTFGCCSRFIECSDSRKCVCEKEYGFNNAKRFQSGCMYKDNLDQGLIYYGINKNYPPNKD